LGLLSSKGNLFFRAKRFSGIMASAVSFTSEKRGEQTVEKKDSLVFLF